MNMNMFIMVCVLVIGEKMIQVKTATLQQEPCPAGTWVYVYAGSRTCIPCSVGTYGTRVNAARCTYCPVGMTTFQAGTIKPESCVERCLPGSGFRSLTRSCKPCPMGQYNSGQGANVNTCKLCPSGWNSRETGATVCDVNADQEVQYPRTDLFIVLLYKSKSRSCDDVISDDITRNLRTLLAEQALAKFTGRGKFCYEHCANVRFKRVKCDTLLERGDVEVEFQITNASLYVQDTRDNSYLPVSEAIGQTLISSGTAELNKQSGDLIYMDFCRIENQSSNGYSCDVNLPKAPEVSTAGVIAVGASVLLVMVIVGIALCITLRSFFKRRLKLALRKLDTVESSQCLIDTGQEMKELDNQGEKSTPQTQLTTHDERLTAAEHQGPQKCRAQMC